MFYKNNHFILNFCGIVHEIPVLSKIYNLYSFSRLYSFFFHKFLSIQFQIIYFEMSNITVIWSNVWF